jgi:hypothetical protein
LYRKINYVDASTFFISRRQHMRKKKIEKLKKKLFREIAEHKVEIKKDQKF